MYMLIKKDIRLIETVIYLGDFEEDTIEFMDDVQLQQVEELGMYEFIHRSPRQLKNSNDKNHNLVAWTKYA